METVMDGAKYDCLLFDMDDTLYPLSSGINIACRKNIQDYMQHHLQIEESQVPQMCLELYREYGTTMAGLKALGFKFNNDEFHAYVHGRLPYDILKPDPVLRNLLLSMPQRKIIFTNADKNHVAEVLSRLGLEDCFEGVICFETLNPPVLSCENDDQINTPVPLTDNDHTFSSNCEIENVVTTCGVTYGLNSKSPILSKPSIEAMEAAIRITNADPKRTIFFDDSPRNIATGKAVGFNTVIVGSSASVPGADHALGSIHNIKEALPEIWEGDDQSDAVLPSTAVETVIRA